MSEIGVGGEATLGSVSWSGAGVVAPDRIGLSRSKDLLSSALFSLGKVEGSCGDDARGFDVTDVIDVWGKGEISDDLVRSSSKANIARNSSFCWAIARNSALCCAIDTRKSRNSAFTLAVDEEERTDFEVSILEGIDLISISSSRWIDILFCFLII